jgi:hypothetical protein
MGTEKRLIREAGRPNCAWLKELARFPPRSVSEGALRLQGQLAVTNRVEFGNWPIGRVDKSRQRVGVGGAAGAVEIGDDLRGRVLRHGNLTLRCERSSL